MYAKATRLRHHMTIAAAFGGSGSVRPLPTTTTKVPKISKHATACEHVARIRSGEGPMINSSSS